MFLGIDVGATKIRAAISDGKEILSRVKRDTNKESLAGFQKQLIEVVKELCNQSGIKVRDLQAICVASFGPLNQRTGELINPVHLPFQRVPIVGPMQKKLGVPVYLVNDCRAAVVGEHEHGIGRGIDNLVFVNLGAGIGAGVYVDGKLILGKDGNAHEVGHYTIDMEERLTCFCGKKGHWEAYCSGRGIVNFAKMKGIGETTPEKIFEKARKGDEKIKKFLEEVGRLNAIGFANVINSYDPQMILVGGALALEGKELILDPIREKVGRYAVNAIPQIELSRLGEEAGIHGAVSLAGQGYYLEFLKA